MASRRRCLLMIAVALWCQVRCQHHHFVPVPFPYYAGGYRHTSSVVNIPVHHERLIIVQKSGGHHPPGEGRGNGGVEQESRAPPRPTRTPFLNSYQRHPQSRRYPYFEDLGFLLDPRFAQQSVWLDQFPNLFV